MLTIGLKIAPRFMNLRKAVNSRDKVIALYELTRQRIKGQTQFDSVGYLLRNRFNGIFLELDVTPTIRKLVNHFGDIVRLIKK